MPKTSRDFNDVSAVPKTPWGRRSATTNEPYYNSVAVAKQLRRYDRSPFIDLLASWMECGPSADDIKMFAAKYPDRWAQSMRGLAAMAGYAERVEVDHNITVNIGRMSDSQLEDSIRKELDGEATEIPSDEPEAQSAEAQTGRSPESADIPVIEPNPRPAED